MESGPGSQDGVGDAAEERGSGVGGGLCGGGYVGSDGAGGVQGGGGGDILGMPPSVLSLTDLRQAHIILDTIRGRSPKEAGLTAQEIIKAVLDFMGLIVSWPVLILVLVFMFRKRVEEAIGVLTERLRRVSVGGATAEFNSVVKSMSGRADEAEGVDDQEAPQEVEASGSPVDETEIRELNQRIEEIRK